METDFRNDFTKFLDEYRSNNIIKHLEPFWQKVMSTYLWYPDIEDDFRYYDGVKQKHIAFRLPGATRGHIVVDENYFIKEIVFYKDTCFNSNNNGIECYKKEIIDAANKKYLNTKLDLINYTLGDEYLYDETN